MASSRQLSETSRLVVNAEQSEEETDTDDVGVERLSDADAVEKGDPLLGLKASIALEPSADEVVEPKRSITLASLLVITYFITCGWPLSLSLFLFYASFSKAARLALNRLSAREARC